MEGSPIVAAVLFETPQQVAASGTWQPEGEGEGAPGALPDTGTFVTLRVSYQLAGELEAGPPSSWQHARVFFLGGGD